MDASLQSDVNSGGIPTGTSAAEEGKYNAWIPFEEGGTENQYNKKLYADEIVDLIGAEETMKLIDFFHKSFGEDMTIDCMYIARHGEPIGDIFFVPWHMDDYATMEITLNDNYEGGEVLHLNEAGVHKTEARRGSVTGKRQYDSSFVSHNASSTFTYLLASSLCFVFCCITAHSTDIVHGITPNKNGAKYMLILKHHFNRPDKVGVIRLSKKLVEKAVAYQAVLQP
jgi:hypothetical protein